MEEILIGKIRSCSVDGVHGNICINDIVYLSHLRFYVLPNFTTVTLGFFEDIVIPPHKLQHPSRFDQMEQAWVWEYDTGDGKKHNLFMDAGKLL